MSRKIITIVFITFFSIMLWVFISLSGDYFYTVKFPIKYTGIPEGLSISNSSTNEVVVSLKGQGWQLAQMTFGRNPEFDVPVEDKPGYHSISLKNAVEYNNWLSTAVEINDLSPSTLEYTLEKIKSKDVPVYENVDIGFKEGYGLVSNILIIPDSVEISGPASVVDGIDHILTVNKSYESVDNTVSENIKLDQMKNINFGRNQVHIEFDVQKIVDKEFENVPVDVRSVPPSKDLTLLPNKVNVVLRGGINLLGKLNASDITAYVKFSQALKDTLGYIVPTVEAPDYTTLINIKPSRIEYIIQQF